MHVWFKEETHGCWNVMYMMFNTNDNLVFDARVNIYHRYCPFPKSEKKNTPMKISMEGNSAE
jgi:hypothetical protein